MTERKKQLVISELKKYTHLVDKYTTDKGYDNFDFFYDGEKNCWECLFFNREDNVAEAYISKTALGIVRLLEV